MSRSNCTYHQKPDCTCWQAEPVSSVTILPEVVLADAEVHRVTAPKRRWRIIGGALSRFEEVHYETQAERDAGAQRLADEYREPVICEFWSFANPHDELNRGWACDGTIQPSVQKENA